MGLNFVDLKMLITKKCTISNGDGCKGSDEKADEKF